MKRDFFFRWYLTHNWWFFCLFLVEVFCFIHFLITWTCVQSPSHTSKYNRIESPDLNGNHGYQLQNYCSYLLMLCDVRVFLFNRMRVSFYIEGHCVVLMNTQSVFESTFLFFQPWSFISVKMYINGNLTFMHFLNFHCFLQHSFLMANKLHDLRNIWPLWTLTDGYFQLLTCFCLWEDFINTTESWIQRWLMFKHFVSFWSHLSIITFLLCVENIEKSTEWTPFTLVF